MSKFDSIFSSLYEEVAGASSTTATPSTTPSSTSSTTANTPATFDQQHPLIQALAKTNDPVAVAKILQDNKVVLPASQVTPTPNAA